MGMVDESEASNECQEGEEESLQYEESRDIGLHPLPGVMQLFVHDPFQQPA